MRNAFSMGAISAAAAVLGLFGAGRAMAANAIFGSPIVEGPFLYTSGDGSVDFYVVGQPVVQQIPTGLVIAPAASNLATPTTWTNAETQAEGLGGHLATVHSAAENLFIVNNVLQDFTGSGGPNLSNIPVWIGLSDPTGAASDDAGPNHASNFVWADGSTSTYRNWNTSTSEPNDASPGEYYAAIQWHLAFGETSDHGTWNDTPDGGTVGYAGTTDGPYYGLIAIDVRTTQLPLPSGLLMGLAGICLTAAGVMRSRRAMA